MIIRLMSHSTFQPHSKMFRYIILPVPMPIMKAPAMRALVKLSMPPPPLGLLPPSLPFPLPPSLPKLPSVGG